MKYFFLFVSIALINNFVLAKYLGLCPFIGVSNKLKNAVGMGMAVVFVMTMASSVTWVVHRYLLMPYGLGFMQTIVFILVIATLVQIVEMFLMKSIPPLYEALGIYLPLITTNCAVLGVALLNVKDFGLMKNSLDSFLMSTLQGFGGGVGFMIVLYLMSGVRERLDGVDIPRSMRGAPIAFICAALMALAFMGFAGMVK